MPAAARLSSAVLRGIRPAPTAWHSRPPATAVRRPGFLSLRNTLLARADAGSGPIDWEQLNSWYDARRREEMAGRGALAGSSPCLAKPPTFSCLGGEAPSWEERRRQQPAKKMHQVDADAQRTCRRMAGFCFIVTAFFFAIGGPNFTTVVGLVLVCGSLFISEVLVTEE